MIRNTRTGQTEQDKVKRDRKDGDKEVVSRKREGHDSINNI